MNAECADNVEVFKRMIGQTRSVNEVHQVMHQYFGALVAPLPALVDALNAVEARIDQLTEDGSEIGARGGRGVTNGDLTSCAA